VKNDALWILARAALWAARPLPLDTLRLAGRALGWGAYLLAGRSRRTALANVARVFPEFGAHARRALVRHAFLTLGELLGEIPALLRSRAVPEPLELTADARETLARAIAAGRGVIFASAHLGPWERVARALVAAGVPFVAVARESYDPRFSRLARQLRTCGGVSVLGRTRGQGTAAAIAIARALRRGLVVGIPMDLRTRGAACVSPFLGHGAPTTVGPALLALCTQAEVVVGSVAPAKATGAPSVVTVTHIATADLRARPRESAHELTDRINRELSRRILALPHAWVWMHERWTASEV
jgi:KDO2-lipid IV(A) lauroyltransferase